MAQSGDRGVSKRLRHRLTLIVNADDLSAAREVLRCASYDVNLRLHHLQERALGLPPVKWAISGECEAPLHTAAQLMQGLAVHLAAVPLVLIRLDTLGTGQRDMADPWPALNPGDIQAAAPVAAAASQEQTSGCCRRPKIDSEGVRRKTWTANSTLPLSCGW